MSRIELLTKDQVQEETKEMFEAMEKNFGMILNLFATRPTIQRH